MMRQTVMCVALALVLALCWGCQKEEEQEAARPVAPPAGTKAESPEPIDVAADEEADAEAEPWVPGELPEIGETFLFAPAMSGDITPMEAIVIELDEAGLAAIGAPCYAGALGLDPVEPQPGEEDGVMLITPDAIGDVVAFYEREVPGAEERPDVVDGLLAMAEGLIGGMGAAFSEEGELPEEDQQEMGAVMEAMGSMRLVLSAAAGLMIAAIPQAQDGITVIMINSGGAEEIAMMEAFAAMGSMPGFEDAAAQFGEDLGAGFKTMGETMEGWTMRKGPEPSAEEE